MTACLQPRRLLIPYTSTSAIRRQGFMMSLTSNATSSETWAVRKIRCGICLLTHDSVEDVQACQQKHQGSLFLSWREDGDADGLAIELEEKGEGIYASSAKIRESDEEEFETMAAPQLPPFADEHIYASGPPKFGTSFMSFAPHPKSISARNSSLRSNVSLASPKTYQSASSTFASYRTAPLIQAVNSDFSKHSDHDPRLMRIFDEIMSRIPQYTEWTEKQRNELKTSLERKLEQPSRSSDILTSKATALNIYSVVKDIIGLKRDGLVEVIEKHICKMAHDDEKVFGSAWLEHLKSRGIILDTKDELNWSGRGQHVEFDEDEEVPLKRERILGHSATAIVESVMCRRIRLARKTIRCGRRISKEEAVTEVQHLQRLAHSHIIRVVGTYTLKKDLAILLYPVTDWNLEEFMDETHDPGIEEWYPQEETRHSRVNALELFFPCLIHVVHWLHNQRIKHMDIKPKNILVRRDSARRRYKLYIADFGIARSYQSAAEAETDSPTSYTRMYAAPEVVQQDKRGFSADIFSLGCVYMEMLATILSPPYFQDIRLSLADVPKQDGNERQRLYRVRCNEQGDMSYQANINAVQAWCTSVIGLQWKLFYFRNYFRVLVELLPRMIDENPLLRPTAKDLTTRLDVLCCTDSIHGPEPFEAAESG